MAAQMGPNDATRDGGTAAAAPAFKAQVLAADRAAREELLAAYLRQIVSLAVRGSGQRAPGDYDFNRLAIHPDPAWLFLSDRIARDLGLHLYPNELIGMHSEAALARYLADQLAPAGEASTAGRTCTGRGSGTRGEWAWSPPRPAAAPPGGRQSAVFVLCSPRSGSTLLRVMLAGHPSLLVPPELFLLPFDGMGQRKQELDRLGYGFMGLGLQQALMELQRCDMAAARQQIHALEAQDEPVQNVYALLRRSTAPRLLVDKSPFYTACGAWLMRAEHLFQAPRYIHLVRHPCAVVESFLRMRFDCLLGGSWGTWDPDPARFATRIWSTWNENALRFLAGIDLARQHRVHYEDLVRSPEAVMRELSDFLGLPFHPAVLRPYDEERMPHPSSHDQPATGAPSFFTPTGTEGGLRDAGKAVPLPAEAEAIAGGVAAALGFVVDWKAASLRAA